jgi:ribosomal RNA assembly protein
MQEIYVEFIKKLLQNKKKLEKELEVSITNKGKNLFVDGNAEKEYIALEVIEAVNLGFSIDKALLLKEEDVILQVVHIKDVTKRHDLERVRARIIGTQGKTLKTLSNLTACEFSLHDNQVGIIGSTRFIEDAVQAVVSLVHGSKQGNVYARAEKQRKRKRFQSNLGLKDL